MDLHKPLAEIRVLLWHWGRRGGGPRYTYELAKALREQPGMYVAMSLSEQCEIVSEFKALNLPTFFVKTYTSKPSALLGLLRLPRLRRLFGNWLREQNFDVVVCTMSHLWNVPMLRAIRNAVSNYLLVMHDAAPHPGDDFLMRQRLLAREIKEADGVVALTDSVRHALCATYQYPEDHTWVIPHGAFVYHRASAARCFPRGRPFQLLFFGRLLPYKGLSLLLDAYRDLLAGGVSVGLTIAGPGDLSLYEPAIRGLNGVIVDNRWIPESEIGSFFSNADLVVTPYVEASQSGVIATAYAAAVPVVTTPIGGLVEQVSEGKTGLVAAEASASALADAIRRFLNNAELYERCSEGALQEARTKLAWPAVAATFAEVIRQVHKSQARARE